MSLFIFGLGYSAMHYVTTRAAHERVTGTVRTAEKAQSVREAHPNIEALLFDAPAIDPPIEDRVASATHLLVSIPPEESGDPVLAHFAEVMKPEVRQLPDAASRELSALVIRHRQLVEMMTAESNRRISHRKRLRLRGFLVL